MEALTKIRIVMVETTLAANIGSAARAMKTMGLTDLVLINPQCEVDQQALAIAAGAEEVVKNAKVYSTLAQGVADCTQVIGASARTRSLPWPVVEPDEMGALAVSEPGAVAIVLGRESSGLTNEELAICTKHVHIPANPDYSSLNVAMAVQVLAWSCRRAALAGVVPEPADEPLATNGQVDGFYQHLEKVLVDIDYLDPNNPRNLMIRLKRLFARTQLEQSEVNILRGILAHIQKKR
ncbi:RNA methyltransferase [Salinibius halmophilus]|uniref:RNA methyltransferase n=1 Tax=Salinibius halmophilus TaxID=1853216 RepID=UPI000E670FAF|nr:RNA methyltransferase [Salinibius halmophilus]